MPEALVVSGFTREETLAFDDPAHVMKKFRAWIEASSKGLPMFVSDNNGFDWQFVNRYLHRFLAANPFGSSSTNLGSLYKGLAKDMFASFQHLQKAPHTHHPVDDAKGNAEALLRMKAEISLKIGL